MRQAEDGDEDEGSSLCGSSCCLTLLMSTLGRKTVILKLKDGTALIFQG